MVSQDNRLIPAGAIDRNIDRPLADLAQSRPYGVTYGGAGLDGTSVRDYLFVILKRKWLILSLVLVVTTLVTIQMFRLPAIYQGETTIRIEPKPRSVLQTKEIIISAQNDPNFWGTQLKLLQNPALARQVVLSLDLQNNQTFFGGRSEGIFSSLRRIFAGQKRATAQSPETAGGLNVVSESEAADTSLDAAELAKLEPYEDAI